MPDAIANITAPAPVAKVGAGRAFSVPATAPNPGNQEPQMDIQQAVSLLSDHLSQQQPPLLVHTMRDQGDLVVQVVDPKDNQVVRQIPSAELLKLARRLSRGEVSLIDRQTA